MTSTASLSENRLDRWLEGWPAVTAEGLGAFRILYATSILLFVHPTRLWVSELPASWWAPPPGPMALLSGPPPAEVVIAGHLVFGVLAGALAIGYRTGSVSVALSVLWLFLDGVAYSWGKIDHGSFLIAVIPLALAVAGWGATFSVDATVGRGVRRVRRWPITAFAALVAFSVATSAIPKILGGWLNLDTAATRSHLLRNHLVHGRDALLAPYATDLPLGAPWPLLDITVIAVELCLVLLLFHRSAFRAGIALLIAFHTGVALTMNISFTTSLWFYAVFAPAVWWSRPAARLGIPVHLPPRAAPIAAAFGGGTSLIVVLVGDRPAPALLTLLHIPEPNLVLGVALFTLALTMIVAWAWSQMLRPLMGRQTESRVRRGPPDHRTRHNQLDRH